MNKLSRRQVSILTGISVLNCQPRQSFQTIIRLKALPAFLWKNEPEKGMGKTDYKIMNYLFTCLILTLAIPPVLNAGQSGNSRNPLPVTAESQRADSRTLPQQDKNQKNNQQENKKKPLIQINTRQYRIRLNPRTPEQIAAFYYGRGFPSAMVKKIQTLCFITIGVRNKTNGLLLLDFNNWKFQSAKGQVKRYTRTHWIAQWKKNQFPLRTIATFRWTVLPEKYEFQPDEGEAGNILLERTDQAFSINATLHLKRGNKTESLAVTFPTMKCASDNLNKPGKSAKP